MTPLIFTLCIFMISILAGLLGALLGLGGGLIVVPALTLLFHIDIRFAVGASLISIIATSSGAAAAYVRERMTNMRVAMFLEIATTCGALAGASLAGILNPRWIFMIFGLMMAYSAVMMLRGRAHAAGEARPDRLADRLRLHASYFDHALGREIPYRVTRTVFGFAMMIIAGVASGLLGIGSGILKVPTMDLAMRLPIKVSSATSNFMIGVTGAASAGLYFMRGDINPFIAAPVAAGVMLGATLGSRLLGRMHGRTIRVIFVAILLWTAFQMLLKGVRG